MILDTLDVLGNYTKMHAGVANVLNFLSQHHLQDLPSGHYDIEKDAIFVSIHSYTTKENPRIEFHKKYIDIQIILEGYEQIGWIPQKDLRCVTPYDSDKDIAFGEGITQKIEAKPGQFFVFFPEDAHQPSFGNGNWVKKAVFKLKI